MARGSAASSAAASRTFEDALSPLAGHTFPGRGHRAQPSAIHPGRLRALLRELDTAGKRAGGLFAAAGALPSGTTDNVRLTILAISGSRRPARALPAGSLLPMAAFAGYVRQGESCRSRLAGKSFERELNNLYVSGPIARAVHGLRRPVRHRLRLKRSRLLKLSFRRRDRTSRPMISCG